MMVHDAYDGTVRICYIFPLNNKVFQGRLRWGWFSSVDRKTLSVKVESIAAQVAGVFFFES